MTQTFFISCRLPSMNEIIAAAKKPAWSKDRYAEMKVLYQSLIRDDIRQAKLKRVTSPVLIRLRWVEPNAKRDLDNIRAGVKFILDALVAQQILPDDTRAHVTGFADTFTVEKSNPGVWVILEPV